MSLPILSVQSNPSVSHPITPTIPFYPRMGDSTGARQRLPEAPSKDSDTTWTVPFRDGLPTPPNDMTGVAYTTIPASNYGGKLDDIALPPYVRPHDNSRMGYSTSTKPQAQSSTQDVSFSAPQKQNQPNPVASYLQMPSSINHGKGNLAEFAAQMTCLFWFENTMKLKAIEDRLNPPLFLVPESHPSANFQKWVTNILSTTQVSQNVVLLALLFIYRLKETNASVRGKKGSEYRLMTIALMLGNKFLDDNTYTNKTWAEVSGISVQEIHVMEVEFLSNVRYNLFVSSENWAKWHTKLGIFADFFNRASRAPEKSELGLTPPMLHVSNPEPTPRMYSPPSKLPSPPDLDAFRSQNWQLPSTAPTYPPAQVTGDVPPVASRKRTRDDYPVEQPSKRVAMPSMIPTPVSTLPSSSSSLTSIPALPSVLAPTSAPSQATIPTASRLPPPTFPPSTHHLGPSVPPSAPGRTMPPMYNPSMNWIPPMAPSSAVPPVTSGLYNPSLSLPDPGRQQSSPFSLPSANVSPAVSAYSVHTPQTHLSPSFFLANRNSPYRPVRNVNTLLIPPPSTSLQQQRSIPFEHMHYQPLGKTAAERKTGVLPYHPDAWQQAVLIPPILHSTPNYSS
ncbi:cyclin-domain-containing protein [Aspergillus ambiguus]|uniref:putative mucin n=1 Tax=Aspergillus ambiguus TaxID=176160 RepID=UPI003CCCB6F6